MTAIDTLRRPTLIGLIAVMTAACVGTHIGNPPEDEDTAVARVGMQAYETEGALTFGLGGELDEAWIVAKSIALLGGAGCDEPVTVLERRTTINLLTGEAFPPILAAEVASGDYCGTRVFLDKGDAGEVAQAPDGLDGVSVYLAGTTNGEAFTFTSVYTGALDLDTDEPFPVTVSQASFVIGFGTQAWLISALIDALPEDLPDSPQVDAARAQILKIIFDSAVLFRDLDDDGQVDAEDLDTQLAGFDANLNDILEGIGE